MADPAQRLAEFAAGPVAGDAALAITDLSICDWAACGIAGARHGEFAAWVASMRQGGDAPVFGGGAFDPAQAALINGTLSHALDYDDTHFAHIGHPSVAVLPAVFALAGRHPWQALRDAALVGIEGSVRAGVWLGRDHYQIGYHQTATAGAFGATLAAGRLLGLSEIQMVNALGLCATMASGLKVQFGTMGKPLNAGLAARTGIEAVLWAQAGMTSSPSAMTAFAATHHGAADMTALDGLGQDWQITSISHKFHACCHGLHAMLEALATCELSEEVARIDVVTHPRWLTVCNVASPDTGLACKFSYRHTAAMAVLGIDTGDIDQFSDAAAQNVNLIAQREKVHVVADDTLSEMQTRMIVTGPKGRQEKHYDLAAPVAIDDLARKLRRKSDTLIGDAASDKLWTAMRAQDVQGFEAAIQG
ncbi:MmgE/PrpD family protein [Yoonia sp. 208BN28-4]|uniref:MmgE/PrpD family protein n=1 Tax=Yoonia sp. 208BN28-4 TaxID=3126505 RepID=UPI00309F056F